MHTKWVILTSLLLGQALAAAELPSAGSQLQQIPAPPTLDRTAPQLDIERSPTPAAGTADSTTIRVDSLRIIGAHAFTQAELIAATGFQSGRDETLSTLRGFAAKITNHYRSHGYFLAQATVPAQDVVDGAVTLSVVEAQYGEVVLRNQSALSDAVARRSLAGLNRGNAIAIAPLERRLLRLADLPGVNVRSTLAPGASVGASDLVVDITPGSRVSGSIDADNAGSRYTGAYRSGATLNFNNPLGRGDVATLRAFTSWDGLAYGRVAYQLRAGVADVGAAYTALDYELGREFQSLEAHGTAQIASLYGRYPLRRSRSNNLYVQINLDAKTFRDEIDTTNPATVSDKEADVSMLSLVGDHRDDLGGGGFNTYSLTWSSGDLDLESAHARNADASAARSNGHYDKLNLGLARLQRLTAALLVYASVQGQLASQNLDVSEKMGLGGAHAVRAYPEGEAYVDQGYLLTLEARLSVPPLIEIIPGQWQLVGFLDSGSGRLSKNSWSSGRNHRTLSAGGVGVNWFESARFTVKAYYAHKLGSAVAISAPDADGRFWINAIKHF